MRLGSRLSVVACAIALVAALSAPAHADDPAPTTTTIAADPGYAGAESTVSVTLADQSGTPLTGTTLSLERRTAGAWAAIATLTTDADGAATSSVTLAKAAADNAFRASYAGDATHASSTATTTASLQRRRSQVTISGPKTVVDEHRITLQLRWRTTAGDPVAGKVRLFRALGDGTWKPYDTLATDATGRAQIVTEPRQDSRWQVRAPQLSWVRGDRSGVHRVDNLPPGKPVHLPRAAPRPRTRLPAQRHAVGAGANATVHRISDRIWSQMTGRSWHSGCPVGRSQLRVVRINYWDYSGYRRRGELITNADAAAAMGGALAEMYARKLPVRAMYPVDRFGWSARSRGANDYASMAAGNTSAFNCRDVTGRPGVRSPHSYGRALDLNTWENPYRSAQGTVPNTWWQGHSQKRVAWRTSSHPVVRIMARYGLRWTYGLGDTQHFDYVGGSSRAAVAPIACHRYCD